MRIAATRDLPSDRTEDYRRARTLSWMTIGFMVIAVILVYLTLGSSQAMKAAWVEDLVSLAPPIAFLVAGRQAKRKADVRHPYGFHRSVDIAYLLSSIVLLGMGLYILVESTITLVTREHPTIGSVQLFGQDIWLGWLMIAVLAGTIVPAFVLGRLQIPLARRLHDKALYATARMLKADWGTAVAGIAGILGIGIGLWWADAVAAIFISLDITHDGWSNTRTAARELADGQPTLVDGSALDPLRSRLETELDSLSWVKQSYVRLRSEGHTFFGDAFVIPRGGTASASDVEKAAQIMKDLDWRLYEMSITPVDSIEISLDES